MPQIPRRQAIHSAHCGDGDMPRVVQSFFRHRIGAHQMFGQSNSFMGFWKHRQSIRFSQPPESRFRIASSDFAHHRIRNKQIPPVTLFP